MLNLAFSSAPSPAPSPEDDPPVQPSHDDTRPLRDLPLRPWQVAAFFAACAALHILARQAPLLLADAHTLQHHAIINNLTLFGSRMLTLRAAVEKPLTLFALSLVHHFFGNAPAPYHAMNAAVHLLNVVLIGLVARRLDARPFVAAGIFAVHPLVTGSTVRAFGISSILGTTFLLLAMLVLLSPRLARRRMLRATLLVVLFALMLLSKPSFIFFPAIIPLFSALKERRGAMRAARGDTLLIVALGLVAVAYSLRYLAWTGPGPVSPAVFLFSELNASPLLLSLFVWPARLAIYHGPIFVDHLTASGALGIGAAIAFGAAIISFRRTPAALFGLAFILALLPCTSVIAKNELIYEWRLYPALVFFTLFVAAVPLRRELFCLIIPLFTFVTARQYQLYQHEERTYRAALELTPDDFVLNYHLARVLMDRNHYAAARGPLDLALASHPADESTLGMRLAVADNLGDGRAHTELDDRLYAVQYPVAPAVPSDWGQVHSLIADLGGKPVVTASWEGRFIPYALDGAGFRSLLSPEERKRLRRYDFYSPHGLADGSLLMTGQVEGRRPYHLYLLDHASGVVKTLTPETERDHGAFCLSADEKTVAYSSRRGNDGEELFAHLGTALTPIPAAAAFPFFSHCAFATPGLLLGIVEQEEHYTAYLCSIGEKVECHAAPEMLRPFKRIVSIERIDDGHIGVIGTTDRWSRSYSLGVADGALTERGGSSGEGDIVQDEPGCRRIGWHSRYFLDSAPDPDVTLLSCRRVGGSLFGVLATPTIHKTLARLEDGRWRPILSSSSLERPGAIRAQELVLEEGGAFFGEGWLYTRPDFHDVVVMFHGGPRETQSPRLNPYIEALNDRGFAVLTFNYPGSTTFGRAYEEGYKTGKVDEGLRRLWKKLDDLGFRRRFTWSVSSGIFVQSAVLHSGVPLDGMIDQAGGYRPEMMKQLEARHIPFFGIRGVYDMHYSQRFFDDLYLGGHDITWQPQFDELFRRLTPFLRNPGRPVDADEGEES